MDFIELKKRVMEKGIKYSDYIKNTMDELSRTPSSELSPKELKRFNFKSLNLQRSTRISKTYSPCYELKKLLANISEPQLWVAITENWCGDSAQSLPYIAAIAELNPLIEFKIILRDSNPDVMDMFLTNGTRSIPKIVAFNTVGNELFIWGPRPQYAVNLINEWKSEGLEKNEWTEKLHVWYAKNKGSELEKEFIDLINKEVLTH